LNRPNIRIYSVPTIGLNTAIQPSTKICSLRDDNTRDNKQTYMETEAHKLYSTVC